MTVAEWTLQGDQNLDYYDGVSPSILCASHSTALRLRIPVSLVDGADLPMRIDNNVGCPVADCPVDLGPTCKYASEVLEISFADITRSRSAERAIRFNGISCRLQECVFCQFRWQSRYAI